MESLLSLMFITEWCNHVQHCNIHLKLEKKYSNWWESQLKLSSMLGCFGYVSFWRQKNSSTGHAGKHSLRFYMYVHKMHFCQQ